MTTTATINSLATLPDVQGLYGLAAHLQPGVSGAGLAASQFAHADGTAGIKTALDTFGAERGGRLALLPAQYALTGQLAIDRHCVIEGMRPWGTTAQDGGAQRGGTVLNVTDSGLNFSTAQINATLRGLGLQGNSMNPDGSGAHGSLIQIGVAGNIPARLLFEDMLLGVSGIGVLCRHGLDTFTAKDVYIISCALGYFFAPGNGEAIIYCKWRDGGVYECQQQGIVLGSSDTDIVQQCVLDGTQFVRCCWSTAVTVNSCNVFLGGTYNKFLNGHSVAAGRNVNDNTQNPNTDGVILVGDALTVGGCTITDNVAGAGIRIRGGYNTVYPNQYRGNYLGPNLHDVVLDPGANNNVIYKVSNDMTIVDNSGNATNVIRSA